MFRTNTQSQPVARATHKGACSLFRFLRRRIRMRTSAWFHVRQLTSVPLAGHPLESAARTRPRILLIPLLLLLLLLLATRLGFDLRVVDVLVIDLLVHEVHGIVSIRTITS